MGNYYAIKGARRLLRDALLMLNKVQNTRLTDYLDSYLLAVQMENYLKRSNNKKENKNASSTTNDR
ncbi:MAG: hypothetical protein WC373_04635 [Smithella sp.]|jgi:hypothetical protein